MVADHPQELDLVFRQVVVHLRKGYLQCKHLTVTCSYIADHMLSADLFEVCPDENEDKPSVHQGEGIVEEEGKIEVEVRSVFPISDVGFGDLLCDMFHQQLQVPMVPLGEPVLPWNNKLPTGLKVLGHALDLERSTPY